MPSDKSGVNKPATMADYALDPAIVESEFVSTKADVPLRVCCYGSSSANTPSKFLKEAWNLGFILAKRGHTCVNGAGSFGCMVKIFDVVN